MRRIGLLALAAASATQMKELGPPPGEAWLTADQVARRGIVVDPVDEHDIDDVRLLMGRVTYDEGRVVHVRSPVSRRIARVYAAVGDHVAKGASLVEIEPVDPSGTSDLQKAEADWIAAKRTFQRIRDLYAITEVTNADFDRAVASLAEVRATLERVRQRDARCRLDACGVEGSGHFLLSSPVAGEVLARAAVPGADVRGVYEDAASPELFTIGDAGTVWVVLDGGRADGPSLVSGMAADAIVHGVATRCLGGAIEVASAPTDGSAPAPAPASPPHCAVANGARMLAPGMEAAVRVKVGSHAWLAVPASSFARRSVVVVDVGPLPDGRERFALRPIAIDESADGPWVPVVHGLDRDDEIVVHGVDSMSEGP
jgi:hypothetical protein